MRICLVYETLYPYFRGGAERWYRNLAERLGAEGFEVTYLTLQRWPNDEPPDVPGVRIVTLGRGEPLYAEGRRRLTVTLRFGAAVAVHLLRHGDRYDAVHTAAMQLTAPAASAARRRHGFRLVVDWHEVWTRRYWHAYLGRGLGELAWRVQRASIRSPHEAICFARLHERRLYEGGYRGTVTRLEGEYAGPLDPPAVGEPEPEVVYLGRHIAEKHVAAVVPAVALARETAPELRATIFGDGPERETVLRQVAENGLAEAVRVPGIVPEAEVDAALRRALCLLHPSEREGYGLVVVEAAAAGTPVIVVDGEDNAAVELVDEGTNGFVAPSPEPRDLAAALLRVRAAGTPLRESTAAWFAANAHRLSLESSLDRIVALYRT